MAECKYLDGKNTIILNGVLQTVLNQNLVKEKYFPSGHKKTACRNDTPFCSIIF